MRFPLLAAGVCLALACPGRFAFAQEAVVEGEDAEAEKPDFTKLPEPLHVISANIKDLAWTKGA